MLKFIFKDSPSLLKKVNNTDLSHKSLITITHDYHNEVCADEDCNIYEKKLSKTKGTYGLIIGLKSIRLNGKEIFLDFRYQRGIGLLEGLNTNTFSLNIGLQIGK